MSRASKITFTLACIFTVTTTVGVHMVQALERETLHQGPIKDAKRVAEKKRLKDSSGDEVPLGKQFGSSDPSKEKKRLFNKTEHEMQAELKKKYEQLQPLSGEIVTEDGEVVQSNK
ncbi:Pet117p NDAI_0E04760 [Naumovozyma dairenensis CBS 421]|uniref:Uncharacterized protein n=1 Tax=Naumovozyma dairenensis (strain ATCC 10597 / BCRC 20456 / CBS 421 / NBRC 0211 / NRRL Y-12639) TaxID=1071378 RepID=G0WAM0_NAUDC|nr:hypothetical protein NDAI_0E04760 [Naumovozyma dairenensis CBS 421]CCD25293.1 hypothetical protein NDAI_0E04760 [Naumovozyma dairenensis CBS 421]